jgi:cytochrome c biogenesis protein CcmG/thiol:disulfide interchange protein DsbE
MSISNKLTFIFSIMAVTIGYSLFHKKKLDNYFADSRSVILKAIPSDKTFKVFGTDQEITFREIAARGPGVMVHFWGTWCAPCEYELPGFLKLSADLESSNLQVILMAVNDDDKKIKKFMKRFGKLPSNITLIHDELGTSMQDYGVVKVPETFLFDKNGRTLTKFTGPQEWEKPFYYQRLKSFVGL